MSDELAELREAVAASRDLPSSAAKFLTGTTLEEIETQVEALARLLGASREREQEEGATEPLANLFANAAVAKAHRKAALLAALGPRPSRARDERGRFTATGFDGGARAPLARQSPQAEHDDLVVRMAQLSRAYGRRF